MLPDSAPFLPITSTLQGGNITFLVLLVQTSDEKMWSMWKEPGQTREKKKHLLPCWFPKLQYPDSASPAKEPWTSWPIFWRRWECSQHFRENTGVQTDRSWSQLVCHWPHVNYQESGREPWRLAHNWLHQHANPLHFLPIITRFAVRTRVWVRCSSLLLALVIVKIVIFSFIYV